MPTDIHPNPFGREYTAEEWAAAQRVGLGEGGTLNSPRGPLIYGGGDYTPDHARQMAKDWALVSAAIDREWTKPLLTVGADHAD